MDTIDRHELALKTHEIIEKRKRQKRLQRERDAASVGWNGYTQYMNKRQKRYYDRRHSV